MTCDKGTPDSRSDNFSSDYFNYVKMRVAESPLTLSDNVFFSECSMSNQDKKQENSSNKRKCKECGHEYGIEGLWRDLNYCSYTCAFKNT